MLQSLYTNFLGNSPGWYKRVIVLFLLANPFIFALSPFAAGWALIIEFIFCLAMALKCYPLLPGGLLAVEAVAIGMVSPDAVLHEVENNLGVILLLMFMVAGIYFMKGLLLYLFTKLLLNVRSKSILSLLFCIAAAVLSAFLDALTVAAVIISVCVGFYSVYHKVVSGKQYGQEHDYSMDSGISENSRDELERFRRFLRSLLMHGAVGTALGGVCTQVGEPQNLIIAERAGWDFISFFLAMAPVTIPVFFTGLVTCLLLEKLGWFGYGERLTRGVRAILQDFDEHESAKMTQRDIASLISQGVVAVILVLSLAFHVAEVGLVGLMVIVLGTSFTGVTEEHQIGRSFEEALPFTALLVVFFSIIAVIHEHHLFSGVIDYVLHLDEAIQPGMFFLANGLLSAISDNVFVATIYIDEVKHVFDQGQISREHFERLSIAINTGTNIPSIATPNGQAAFLFLLTSAIAPLIRLSYGKMVLMALPYTIILTIVGYFAIVHIA